MLRLQCISSTCPLVHLRATVASACLLSDTFCPARELRDVMFHHRAGGAISKIGCMSTFRRTWTTSPIGSRYRTSMGWIKRLDPARAHLAPRLRTSTRVVSSRGQRTCSKTFSLGSSRLILPCQGLYAAQLSSIFKPAFQTCRLLMRQKLCAAIPQPAS